MFDFVGLRDSPACFGLECSFHGGCVGEVVIFSLMSNSVAVLQRVLACAVE
jgi:hypothetical protein